MKLINSLNREMVQNSKSWFKILGISRNPNPLAFQKVNSQVSLLHKDVRVFHNIKLKFIESHVSIPPSPFVGNKDDTFLVFRSGKKVFFFTIRQQFYSGRQTPWKSQSTDEEGKSVLRKLWIS